MDIWPPSSEEDPTTVAPLLTTDFCISGWDFDPAICTTALGMEPSQVWRQTNKYILGQTRLPNICWSVGFTKRPLYSVSEAVDEVLDVIWSKRESIKQFSISEEFQVSIVCNVTIEDDRPVYDLSLKTIQCLAELGCDFCLDIFDYSD